MDLIYTPEILSYGAVRSPQYRDYEQPWNKDYFNYGKPTTAIPNYRHRQVARSSSKDSCHLCRESKRRSLAAYIRGKARKDSCNEIHEEDEEVDGNVEEVVKTEENSEESKKTKVVQKEEQRVENLKK